MGSAAVTLLRWHRRLDRWRRTYSRKDGRPPVDSQIAALIGQMARENRDGATSGSRAIEAAAVLAGQFN